MIVEGLGSTLWNTHHKGSMVKRGSSSLHQLPRIVDSHTSSTIICNRQIQAKHSAEDRQHYCSGLHISITWGNNLQRAGQSDEEFVNVVPGEGRAQHLPRALNTITDLGSRSQTDRRDWRLSLTIFHRIQETISLLKAGLFATHLSTQCPCYFSWWPDLSVGVTDAFFQVWTHIKGFANPPWSLIGRTLGQVQTQQASIVLVAPVWISQSWYPTITAVGGLPTQIQPK